MRTPIAVIDAIYRRLIDPQPVVGLLPMVCEIDRRLTRSAPACAYDRAWLLRTLGWTYAPGRWQKGDVRTTSAERALAMEGVGS